MPVVLSEDLRGLKLHLKGLKQEYKRISQIQPTAPPEENKKACEVIKQKMMEVEKGISILEEVHSIGSEESMLKSKL